MIIMFEKVLAIFIIIAVGFLVSKLKVIPQGTVGVSTKLIMLIFLPSLIITSISSRELSKEIMAQTLITIGLSALMFTLFSFIGYFLAKYVFKFNKEDLGVYLFCFGTANTGFVGFPITLAIFGETTFYYLVIVNVVLAIYTNGFGKLVVHIGGKKEGTHISFKSLLNPCMISVVIGLFLLFSGLHLPTVLLDPLEMLGDATIPLSLLVVGFKLAESDFKKLVKNVKLLAYSALKVFILPIIAFLAVFKLNISSDVKIAITMSAVFSTAVITTVIAEDEHKNSLLASEIVALTTLMSMVTIPLAATFLTSYFGL